MSYDPAPQAQDWSWIWKKWISGFQRYTEETGTWTPEYSSSSAPTSIDYDQQTGLYVRKGGILHTWFYVGTDSLTVGSGELQLTGLPWANSGSIPLDGYVFALNFVGSDSTFNSAKPTRCFIGAGDSHLVFRQTDNTTVDATASYLATGTNSNRIRGYISYPVEV